MRIFVDDLRTADGFDYIAESAEDFFSYCNDNNVSHIELLSLDYQLGDNYSLTGYDIVSRLPELNLSIGTIQFHTSSPMGFIRMLDCAMNLKSCEVMEIGEVIEDCLDSQDF